MEEIFYYHDDESMTIYWSTEMSDRTDLIFLGSSLNPNKKVAVAAFVKSYGIPRGWKIKPLD